MKAIVIKHVPFEGCGNIEEWLNARGARWRIVRLYEDDPLPQEFPDLVVIMGGPMSVNDEALFPWLAREKACIRDWIAAGVPLLGVCLGAQLIASAMGGHVVAGEKEIGWFPVVSSAPQECPLKSFCSRHCRSSLPRYTGMAITSNCRPERCR